MAKICLVLSSIEEIPLIKQIKNPDLIELRLDLLDIPVETIPELMKISNHWMLSIREKLFEKPNAEKLILSVLSQHPNYLDIDEKCLNNTLIHTILSNLSPKIKRIYSYHNFEFTPEISFLEEKVEKLLYSGADIVKIACLGTKNEDIRTIEKLNEKFPKLIAFLMGENFIQTRYEALLNGEKISYACLHENYKIAPGQPSYQDMKKILESNKNKYE